jgi:uroporphyrinogen-III synthase
MRVIVTRPAHQAGELATRLEEMGHEVVLCPLIELEPLGDDPVDVGGYDWLVVTSANGARELARRGLAGARPRIAVVGPTTARELADAGLDPDLVAEESSQDGLLAALPRPAGRVLLAAAEGARDLLGNELGADLLPLYRTTELRPDAAPSGDLAVLTSPSQARAFAQLGLALPVVTIGPQTSLAARELGLDVVAEAVSRDVEGLVAAVGAAR